MFGLVLRKRLNHAALAALPKLRVASSSLVARFSDSYRMSEGSKCWRGDVS